DKLVIATGSRVATPPILGLGLHGVIRLRTDRDAARIRAAVRPGSTACVVGGGLLGLEAAAALAEHGAEVTVVHGGTRLMDRQLDAGSARWLQRRVEQRGIACHVGARCEELVEWEGRVVGVRLQSGVTVPADLVVMATGVSPVISVAARAGIATERGIVVDDQLRTSAPDVWAIGECAQHDGTVYGTWAPIAEQAKVLGADLSGRPAGFRGRPQPTRLKVPGLDVFSCGGPTGEIGDPDLDEVVAVDSRAGTYRRLVFRGRDLIGAVLLGDLSLAGQLTQLLEDGGALPDAVLDGLLAGVPPDPAAEVVCSCKSVTAAQISDAIDAGSGTVEAVRETTGASSGCGSCAGRVGQLLAARVAAAAQA
ncbi:MAG: FAD-dependent oxidoreductase, partial [Solirubrobacteraceae bacterium]